MGLDMYLHAKQYVRNWNHSDQSEKDCYNRVASALGLSDADFSHLRNTGKSVDISLKVAYWRKANAIHKWFVGNCQGGVDDCRDAEVSREQLAELVQLCKTALGTLETVEGELDNGTTYYGDGRVVHHKVPGQVVAQATLAAATLPTQAGFFFGSTDYDEYYLAELRQTVEQLEAVLNNPKFEHWHFEYSASW